MFALLIVGEYSVFELCAYELCAYRLLIRSILKCFSCSLIRQTCKLSGSNNCVGEAEAWLPRALSWNFKVYPKPLVRKTRSLKLFRRTKQKDSRGAGKGLKIAKEIVVDILFSAFSLLYSD